MKSSTQELKASFAQATVLFHGLAVQIRGKLEVKDWGWENEGLFCLQLVGCRWYAMSNRTWVVLFDLMMKLLEERKKREEK